MTLRKTRLKKFEEELEEKYTPIWVQGIMVKDLRYGVVEVLIPSSETKNIRVLVPSYKVISRMENPEVNRARKIKWYQSLIKRRWT